MAITKQENFGYSNTNEQEILVNVEAIIDDTVPAIVPEGEDNNVPAEQTMTTDLVVASNSNGNNAPESVTDTTTVTETDDIPEPAVAEPDLEAMKRRRVRSQTAAGWIGGATGLILLGVPWCDHWWHCW